MFKEIINNLLSEKVSFKNSQNIYLKSIKDLKQNELKIISEDYEFHLNEKLFKTFSLNKSYSSNDDNKINIKKSYSYINNNVLNLQKYLISDDIKYKILYCIFNSEYLIKSEDINLIIDDEKDDYTIYGFYDELVKTNMETTMTNIETAYKAMEGKHIITLSDQKKLKADICKLQEKYFIRLSDGNRYVASDDVKVVFRDPSSNPSWATWFLGAVPLKDIPNRAVLLFMDEDERQKHYPKEIQDHPVICHASLWKLGNDATGVLLHTSWHSIAVSYRWKIQKPIEIASIMFRACSHPAHIAKNFGYAPQMVLPGDDWF